MTREELVQSPEYWRDQYENECYRLGIKPDKIAFVGLQPPNELKDGMTMEEAMSYVASRFSKDKHMSKWDKCANSFYNGVAFSEGAI